MKKITVRIYLIACSALALASLPILMALKLLSGRTVVTCRVNARYFGHLGFNAAIASAHAIDPGVLVLASFIHPVVNRKLQEVAYESLYVINDRILEIIERIYYAVPSKIRRLLSNFVKPMIDDRSELREFIHFDKLAGGVGDWKEAFWRSANLLSSIRDVGILVAVRTSEFHGTSSRQILESYRNMSPQEVIIILEAALNNSVRAPVTFYGPSQLFEEHIKPRAALRDVKFADQACVDILDLLPGAQLLINNGNGIGAVAAVANLRVLYLKHSPWHAWHTFHTLALVVPAVYSYEGKIQSTTLDDLCRLALKTLSVMPFDYEQNFLTNGVELNTLNKTDLSVVKSSIEEALSLNPASRVADNFKGASFMYSSKIEHCFWRAYIDNMPSELLAVHSDIRVAISSSFLNSRFES